MDATCAVAGRRRSARVGKPSPLGVGAAVGVALEHLAAAETPGRCERRPCAVEGKFREDVRVPGDEREPAEAVEWERIEPR